jgi:sulfatase modifying factor 1
MHQTVIVKRTLRTTFIVCAGVLVGCGVSAPELSTVRSQMTSEQIAVGEPLVNSVGIVLVPIPAGEFQMGTAAKKKGKQPQWMKPETFHEVQISKPFYISACEVTQEQYEAVTAEKPWSGQPLVQEEPTYAATYITWDQATTFCQTLSDTEGVEYRLPTEAEWEYACRAGPTTAYSFGDDRKKLTDHAWYDANAYKADEQFAHAVGQKLPNPWALYDMHGNAWEWCSDWYARYDTKQQATVDPTGPKKGQYRVWRGGSFAETPDNMRSASRVSYGRANYRPTYLAGFRVVRVMTP